MMSFCRLYNALQSKHVDRIKFRVATSVTANVRNYWFFLLLYDIYFIKSYRYLPKKMTILSTSDLTTFMKFQVLLLGTQNDVCRWTKWIDVNQIWHLGIFWLYLGILFLFHFLCNLKFENKTKNILIWMLTQTKHHLQKNKFLVIKSYDRYLVQIISIYHWFYILLDKFLISMSWSSEIISSSAAN